MKNRFERDDSSKVILIVIGSVVGALLLLVVACSGMAFYFITKTSQAMGPQLQAQAELMAADVEVQTFLNALAVGQFDTAYNNTTPGFRARQTLPQFTKFVERNPLLTKFRSAQKAPPNNAPGAKRMTLQYTLNGDGVGVLNLTFQLVEENEQWKIDSVSVP
jgi:hypothetical protein